MPVFLCPGFDVTFPVFRPEPAAGLTYEITSADLTLAFAETPTAIEVQTYFNTLGDTSFNDNIIYTSPAGIEHPFTVGTLVGGALKVFKTPIDRIEFVDLPLSTTVAPGTRVAATVADEFRHFIRVDPGTYAEEAIGGAGGGADGNGLIRAEGDSIPAGGHAYILNTLWRNTNGTATAIPAGATPATMGTAGFVDALQAAAGSTDVIAKSFVATAGQSIFVLDSTPTDADSVELTISGSPVQVLGVDYTLSVATVTLAAPVAALIQAGDSVRITYI